MKQKQKGMVMGDDKRRFTRIPFKVNSKMEAGGRQYCTNELCNLSVGGCLLPVQADIPPGTRCQITIWLNGQINQMNVNVIGQIIRCDPGNIAIKFISIEPESLFHLQNIIRHNAPDPDMVENEISEHPGIL